MCCIEHILRQLTKLKTIINIQKYIDYITKTFKKNLSKKLVSNLRTWVAFLRPCIITSLNELLKSCTSVVNL